MALHSVPIIPLPPETRKEKAQRRMKAAPKPTDMLQCPRCGGRELIETKIGVLRLRGQFYGGTKSLICASCQMRGERVVVA